MANLVSKLSTVHISQRRNYGIGRMTYDNPNPGIWALGRGQRREWGALRGGIEHGSHMS